MWTVMGWLLAVVFMLSWVGARGRLSRAHKRLIDAKLEKVAAIERETAAHERAAEEITKATERMKKANALLGSLDKEATERAQRIIDEMGVRAIFAEMDKRPGISLMVHNEAAGRQIEVHLSPDTPFARQQWARLLEIEVMPKLAAKK